MPAELVREKVLEAVATQPTPLSELLPAVAMNVFDDRREIYPATGVEAARAEVLRLLDERLVQLQRRGIDGEWRKVARAEGVMLLEDPQAWVPQPDGQQGSGPLVRVELTARGRARDQFLASTPVLERFLATRSPSVAAARRTATVAGVFVAAGAAFALVVPARGEGLLPVGHAVVVGAVVGIGTWLLAFAKLNPGRESSWWQSQVVRLYNMILRHTR